MNRGILGGRTSRRLRRLYQCAIGLSLLLSARVLYLILAEYPSYFPPDFESAFLTGRESYFFGWYRYAFYAHIISGPLSLLMVFFLMVSGLRSWKTHWHRSVGGLMVVLVLFVMAPSGWMMSCRAYTGPIAGWGFATLSVLTAVSAVATWHHARQRKFAVHRKWATRLLICMCSPLLLRLMSGAVIVLQQESELTYRVSAWCSWLIPLATFETWRQIMKYQVKSKENNMAQPSVALATAHSEIPLQIPLGPGRRRHGFNVIELLVFVVILVILVGLFLPVTRTTREAARRSECMNRIRQIGLGLHTFHDRSKRFPCIMGDPTFKALLPNTDTRRYSGLVALLPYLEQNDIFEQLDDPWSVDGQRFPYAPEPSHAEYPIWKQSIGVFQCPSSAPPETEFGFTHYGFCVGDIVRDIHQPKQLRGAFAAGHASRLDTNFTDGTSCTLMMAEIGGGGLRCFQGNYAIGQPASILEDPLACLELKDEAHQRFVRDDIRLGTPPRGGCWSDGSAALSMFNTALGPGSPSAAVGEAPDSDGIYSATGPHPAGVNVLMADGSVHYVNRRLDRQTWMELGLANDGTRPRDF